MLPVLLVQLVQQDLLELLGVQDLLEQINNSQGITIDTLMAYWLNQIQSTSTLLGTVRKFSSNYYVTRTILD